MKKDEIMEKLKRLRRDEGEGMGRATVSEAIDVLIQSCEYLLLDQPERPNPEAHCIHEWMGIPTTEESWCKKCGIESHEVRCDGLNTMET